MSRRLLRLLTTTLLLLPFGAAAMQSLSWDFRRNIGAWEATSGLKTQLTANGLHIVADREGAIFTEVNLTTNVDALRVIAKTPVDMEMKFLWESANSAEEGAVELPFILRADGTPSDVDIVKYRQWNPKTQTIGFAFPPGTDVTIEHIELRGWNMVEKLEQAFLSTWRFDTFRAYSINFLWGPLVVTTPVLRAQLFDSLPPYGLSLNDVFYAAIILAGLIAIGAQILKLDEQRRAACMSAFLCVVAGSYVLYDLRMSAEILSYAKSDLTQYVFAEKSEKEFRIMDDFWTMVEDIRPNVKEDDTIVFVADGPFLSYVRYALYPATVIPKDAPRSAPALWIVYDKDTALDSQKRLMIDGVTVSGSGTVIGQPRSDTLLFREQP